MTSIELIAKHLDRANLRHKVHQVNTICKHTGFHIKEGVLFSDVVSDVFNDWYYFSQPSDYVSVEVAMCLSDVIPNGEKRNNSLRTYSYFATENEFRFLSRENALSLLLDIPAAPFVIAISENQQKHTPYKTVLNTDKENIWITYDSTDNLILFKKVEVLEYLPIIQNWYSVLPSKKDTTEQPTFFTKKEILNGNAEFFKIQRYGAEKYEQENDFLQKYRYSQIFQLVTYLLNKQQ